MHYVFLIGAEHQLEQVFYAIEYFSLQKKDLTLIVEKVSDNVSFAERIVFSTTFSSVIVYDSWQFKDIFIYPQRHLNFIQICKHFIGLDTVFLASHYDTDSTFLFNEIVKPSKFYLMDEGTASFYIVLRRETSEILLNFKILIKSIVYKVRLSLPKNLTYFTKFNLDIKGNDNVEIYKTSSQNNKLINTIEGEFLFLGSSIVESNLIDEQVYLDKLAIVINSNKIKSQKFIYVPHRKEQSNKLEKIEKLGFDILSISIPFEKYFQIQEHLPDKLASFFTTSVISNIAECNSVLPNLLIYKFDVKYLKRQSIVYQNIYNAMIFNKNIQFIEI